jgi:hypothetical protein
MATKTKTFQSFAVDINHCPRIAALLEKQKEAKNVKYDNMSDFVNKAISELLKKEESK